MHIWGPVQQLSSCSEQSSPNGTHAVLVVVVIHIGVVVVVHIGVVVVVHIGVVVVVHLGVVVVVHHLGVVVVGHGQVQTSPHAFCPTTTCSTIPDGSIPMFSHRRSFGESGCLASGNLGL